MLRKVFTSIILATLLAVPAPLGADAQQVLVVTGQVVDAAGTPVDGAAVHVSHTKQYTLTDSTGAFELANVPATATTIIGAKEGYNFTSVRRGSKLTIKLTRQPRPVAPAPWLSLNGTWSFDLEDGDVREDRWYGVQFQLGKAIRVPYPYSSPAAFGERPYPRRSVYADFSGAVRYKRDFTVPKSFATTRLRTGAIGPAEVWLDEALIHVSPTGELDLNLGRLTPGTTHTLAIRVTTPGGIRQPVWLESRR